MKLLILIFLPITVFAQNWTEPVNISYDMSILDNQPDLCIDKNGRLHCVFTHKLDNNWRKIYYSQSTDYGFSWIIPEDISLNTDLSLLNPHVKADSNNNIYVSWDYNTGNPEQTQIYIKKYNGTYWEEAVNITPNEPESHGNALVIDNNNRLYCFWGKGGYNSNTYYKYLENDKWSETICPYPGNHYWAFTDFAVDDFNNIHCIGM
ncbi:MAG: sialidase family protein, partial [Bacteroidota bacterium]